LMNQKQPQTGPAPTQAGASTAGIPPAPCSDWPKYASAQL
jgi:hypothetical protein